LAAIPPLSSGAGQPTGLGGLEPDAVRQARAAAQRAFFQSALNRVQATAQAPGRQDTQTEPNPPANAQTGPSAGSSDRPLRPGSLLNIVV
jgi:hypothetical protein